MTARLKNSVAAVRAPRIFLVITILFLTGYIFARAYLLSFTHDEALTLMTYVTQPWKNLLKVDWTNNHLLNSILARLCLEWFGPSEISLRLPNVISGIVFFCFAAKLSEKITGPGWKSYITFLFIACNPFLLDFFSLCRGYGISMGFLMAGLYYFYCYFETRRQEFSLLSFIFSAIALAANYTLLNLFLIQVVCFIIHEIIIFRRDAWKKQVTGSAVILLLVAVFLEWFLGLMFGLRQYGNFNFGGTDGFWKDSVGSLLHFSLGIFGKTPGAITVFTVFIMALIAAGAIILFYRVKKSRSAAEYFMIFLLAAMTGCALALWIQHIYMQIPYSPDRTVLYFLVLFPLFLAGCFFTPGSFARLRFAAASAFLLFPFLAFSTSMNLHTTLLWSDNANAKEGIERIIYDSKASADTNEVHRVGVSFINYPVYNYYIYKEKASWLDHVFYGDFGALPGTRYDLLIHEADMPPAGYEQVWEKDSLFLYRQKEAWKLQPVFSVSENFEKDPPAKSAAGYQSKFSLRADDDPSVTRICDTTLAEDTDGWMIFRLTADMKSEVEFPGARIGVNIWRDSTLAFFCEYPVSWFLYKPKAWNYFEHNHLYWKNLSKGDRVECFIRNEEKNILQVDNFSFSILK